MIQRQITDHKSNNSLALVGCTRVLSEIILKFRHLKYMIIYKKTDRQNYKSDKI